MEITEFKCNETYKYVRINEVNNISFTIDSGKIKKIL